jgi:hypothetical protein
MDPSEIVARSGDHEALQPLVAAGRMLGSSNL